MPAKSPIVLFGGPSLSARSLYLAEQLGMDVRPPIKREDIPLLLKNGFQGTLILVDGVFHQVVSVGHKELIQAIQLGCDVYGVSSMGAIRAYELRYNGMKGFGAVYDFFEREEDFQDDEVALLHEPIPPYRAASEPLVHFRVCVADLVNKQQVTAEVGASIIDQLKALYFGERTMELFQELLQEHTSLPWDQLVPDFEVYRIKFRDVEKLLTEQPWQTETSHQ